jgi:hypothetical protein
MTKTERFCDLCGIKEEGIFFKPITLPICAILRPGEFGKYITTEEKKYELCYDCITIISKEISKILENETTKS